MPGPGDTVVASVGLAVHSLKSAKLPCVHADSTHAVSLANGAAKGTTKGTARGANGAESSVTEVIGAAATFLGLPRGMISFEIYFKTTHVKKRNCEWEQRVFTVQRPATQGQFARLHLGFTHDPRAPRGQ